MALDQEVTTVQDSAVIDPATLEPAINAIITESKAGYKTTEFWVGVVVSLLTLLGTAPVPDKAKGIILGVIAAAYAISRGIAKQGIPAVEPTPPA